MWTLHPCDNGWLVVVVDDDNLVTIKKQKEPVNMDFVFFIIYLLI